MIRFLKLVHYIGLVLFLGSILSFVVISGLIEDASLENIAFGRSIISAGTNILTLPGMWIITLTGITMGYKIYSIKQRFFQIKLALIILIITNAYLFVVPAVSSATEFAVQSLTKGQLLPEYKEAYIKESIFGGINVLLTITGAIIGVWKAGVKSTVKNR